MGYWAGLGAGKGWIIFNFILMPEELEEIFEGLTYSFVNTSSRVDLHYTESGKQEYFRAYQVFSEQILTGNQLLTRQEEAKIESDIRVAIIDDVSKISYRAIKDERGKTLPYKMAEPLEPVVNISPFYLHYLEHKDSLSVAFFNEPGVIGLQFSYPKYITWHNTQQTGTIETNCFDSFTLFDTMVERIKKRTQKAKVESKTKQFKPNFRISKNAISVINENKYLREKGFTIK